MRFFAVAAGANCRLTSCSEKTIAPLFKGTLHSVRSVGRDRLPAGFCNEFLLGVKYDGWADLE